MIPLRIVSGIRDSCALHNYIITRPCINKQLDKTAHEMKGKNTLSDNHIRRLQTKMSENFRKINNNKKIKKIKK